MKSYFALLLSLLSLLAGQSHAQYDPEKVNKEAARLHSKALELAQNDNNTEAIQAWHQALAIDNKFEDAYLSLAGMYGQLKNYPLAISNFEKARAIDSNYFKDFNLSYSIDLAGMGNFEAAMQAVTNFLSIPILNERSRKAGEYRRNCYQFALDYPHARKTAGYTFEPHNLGDSINTRDAEYYPTISLDGHTLIFTRRVNDNNEDFYQSTLTGGRWSKAISLPGNINTNENEAAQSISLDGQLLIFNGCNFPNGLGSCDLYISYLTPDGWGNPENLGDSVNTEFWESGPSLSPDKKDLYFSSNRPGGYGGSDIYVCHRKLNGHWSEAVNMGPGINTAGDEATPFIHADNQTLYFNSSGQPGYGGNDLFLSRKSPDGSWGNAVNLGYPINTIEDEGSLVVAADGRTAYYASDRADSRGELDLYTFGLPEDVRPAQTLWVKGKVFDRSTRKGLPSSVELTDLSSRAVISNLQTDETGNYLITLPKGKDYAFNVNRKGYLFFSENFPLSRQAGDTAYNIDIALQPLEADAVITLRNIFFDFSKYELKPESQVELDKVVQLMRDNPTLKIQINGHTDNAGKTADNLRLSENRAKAVVSYLVTKGIIATRLSFKGWGDIRPVADNTSAEGRALNRRTELKVVSR
jgi:outer membrane protein OmpA-like peptidoglycan-associated protein/Tol biopolymer transport system component